MTYSFGLLSLLPTTVPVRQISIIEPVVVSVSVTKITSLPSSVTTPTLLPVTSIPKEPTMASMNPTFDPSILSVPSTIAATPTVVQPANTPSTTVSRVLTNPISSVPLIRPSLVTIPVRTSATPSITLPNPNQSLPILGGNQNVLPIPSTPDATTYTEPVPRPTGTEYAAAVLDPAGACVAIGGQYIDGVCYPPGLKPVEEEKDNTLLYVGIAGAAVAGIGLLYFLTRK